MTAPIQHPSSDLETAGPLSGVPTVAPSGAGFGVYVHWPFCAAKCPYCDFNSHVPEGEIDQAGFEAAYLKEIAYWATRYQAAGMRPGPLTSIFFGGGTPSLMAPFVVEAVLAALEAQFGFAENIEITLEANPQSVDAANFRALKLAGVNRLSIGVQSFEDAALRQLGRLHNVAEARRAIETARGIFERFSFDLIYARPGQSLEGWEDELRQALEFEPRHLSLYQLTIEPNTAYQRLYAAGKLKMPHEDLAGEFYELTQARLQAARLLAYEISNHAVPGEEARHNLLYWRYGDYIGIGPGAHGRVSLGGKRFATETEKLPGKWRGLVASCGNGLVLNEEIPRAEQAVEMLLMGLRVNEGIFLPEFEVRVGHAVGQLVIDEMVEAGLLLAQSRGENGQRLIASPYGRQVLNSLTEKLVAGLVPV